jgi:hypothetical protein
MLCQKVSNLRSALVLLDREGQDDTVFRKGNILPIPRLIVPEKTIIKQRLRDNNKSCVNLFTWNLKAVHSFSFTVPYVLIRGTQAVTFLGAFAKLRKAIVSCIVSVRMEQLVFPQDGFSLNLVFEYF